MKANELRIGNLLQDNSSLLLEVVGLCNFKILRTPPIVCRALDEDTIKEIGVVPEDIRPIPLTEKWLLKFGFVNNWNGFSKYGYWKDDFKIISAGNSVFYTIINGKETEIKYVHQLQNLYFALTGEELTINK